MSSIDSRIVDMKFNNAQFASGVQSTIGMLGRLKESLHLDGAAKSLDGLNAAGKNFSLSHIATAVDGLASKFSALSVIGITALSNIANKAVNAGLTMVKSLTIDPIKQGFAEYETNMNSIQTILANTQKYGTTLKDVTRNLDELNTYSDKTIYNFSDMTKNIGLFTNAGIKIDDATSMIKGFSNAAAASGTSAEGAAGAAYQLSQGLSSGKITLMDWKSLTNVGMGNKNMQNSIIDIADAMGTFKGKGTDAASAQKNFNSTLEKGWLTADVMSTYLRFMAGDIDAAALKTMGLSDATIKSMVAEQKTAEEAATKVRTFTALMGTLRESVGSGWSTTFKTLFGDFNEATALWTGVNSALGAIISKSANARNKMLGVWKALGGRNLAIDAIKNSFNALMKVITTITAAFRQIFPAMTGKDLFNITKAFDNFTKKLIMSKDTAENLKHTFAGIFAVFSIVKQVIMAVAGVVMAVLAPLFNNLDIASGGILAVTGSLGDWIVALDKAMKGSTWFSDTFAKVSAVIKPFADVISFVATKISDFTIALFQASNSKILTFVTNVGTKFWELVGILSGPVRKALDSIISGFKDFQGSLHFDGINTGSLSGVQKTFEELRTTVVLFGTAIYESLQSKFEQAGGSIKTFGALLYANLQKKFENAGASIIAFGVKVGAALTNVADAIKNIGSGASTKATSGLQTAGEALRPVWQAISDIFDSIRTSLGRLGGGIKNAVDYVKNGIKQILAGADPNVVMGTLNLSIFAAVAIMVKKFVGSLMDTFTGGVKKSLSGALDQLTGTLKAMQTNLKADALKKIAMAILILAAAVMLLSLVNPDRLMPAVLAMSAMLVEMLAAMALLDKITSNKGFLKIPILALSLALLGGAMILFAIAAKKFGAMKEDDLKRGLVGIAVALAASNLARGGKMSGFALLLLAFALNSIADAMEKMAGIPWDALKKGTLIMAVILLMIAAFGAIPFDGVNVLVAAAAMIVLAFALTALTKVIQLLAGIKWDVFTEGLKRMALALVAIAVAMSLMPPGMVLSALAIGILALTLTALAGAIVLFSKIDWKTFTDGIGRIGLALVVLGIGLTAMLVALPGAVALIVAAVGLGMLVPVLLALGKMEWDVIKKGLIAIAAVLILLAVGGLLLIPASVGFLLFAAAILIMGVAAVVAGVGLGLMGVGLAAVAASGAVAIPLLIKLLESLIGMLPQLAASLAQALIAIIQVIGTSAPIIGKAFTGICLALLVSLNAVVPPLLALIIKLLQNLLIQIAASMPQFMKSGMSILLSFLTGIKNNIYQLVTVVADIIIRFLNALAAKLPAINAAGVNLLIKLLQGLAQNIGNVVTAGAKIIVQFLQGIARNLGSIITAGANIIIQFIRGIGSNANRIIDAAADTIIKFVRGLSTSIDAHSSELGAAGGKLAGSIVSGLVKGLGAGIWEVGKAAGKLASAAWDKFTGLFKPGSPSKTMIILGKQIDQGLVIGMNNYAGLVANSSNAVGAGAINAMRKSISGIADVINEDIDMTPVIRPVLDLTAVKKDATLIGGLLGKPSLAVGKAYEHASSVAAERSAAQWANMLQPESEKVPATTVSFTQNNNSPKALSNAEIYRQTKNQLSVVKGALTA